LFQQFVVLADAGDDEIYVLGTAAGSTMRLAGTNRVAPLFLKTMLTMAC
jgi:hypothetical protein